MDLCETDSAFFCIICIIQTHGVLVQQEESWFDLLREASMFSQFPSTVKTCKSVLIGDYKLPLGFECESKLCV